MEEDNPQFSTVFNPFSHILIPHMHTLSYLTSYKVMLDRFLLACEFGIQCKAICHASTSGREYSTMLALYFNIYIKIHENGYDASTLYANEKNS